MDTTQLLRDYFSKYGTAHVQIDLYNHFVRRGIEEIIESEPEIEISSKKNSQYFVKFGQVHIEKPQVIEEDRTIHYITPSDARLRDLTYESSIYVDIHEKTIEGEKVEEKVHHRVIIGQIPTMVRSITCALNGKTGKEIIEAGECKYDEGGYFIIKGKERVIVAQQRANYNFVQTLEQKMTNNSKYKLITEIRSISEESNYSSLVQCMIGLNDRTILFSLPHVQHPIPAGIVLKAMGFTTDEEISELIDMKNKKGLKYLNYIIRDSAHVKNVEEATTFIGHNITGEAKVENLIKQIFQSELLPHLGVTATMREKAIFLGYMLNKLISTVIGVRKDDDRDNVSNKRIDTTGILLYDLFRDTFKKFVSTLKVQLEKRSDILFAVSRANIITKSIRYCFSTGNWGVKKANRMRTGVSQVLSRMTYAASKSHLRHIVIPIGKEGKNAKIRQIHTSQFGFICPAETPEGATSGIVTNFSLLAKVTKGFPKYLAQEILTRECKSLLPVDISDGRIKVFLNGFLLGLTEDETDLLEEIEKLREKGVLDSELSAIYDSIDDEVRIYCDEGRLIRPLFVVKKLSIPFSSWDDAVKKGVIRYVDSNEVENSVIAMDKSYLGGEFTYDFLEIHPSMILGVCASIIPFPDHSQSPRNCYQSSMGKQALGIPTLSYEMRTDTMTYVLDYPQQPVVSTESSRLLHFSDMPSGQSPIVAVTTKEGFNQEDSVCLNKSAIDRGLFRVTAYHTITDKREDKEKSSNCVNTELPPQELRRANYNYSFLDSKGIVKVGSPLKKDDVIIGKVLTKISKEGEKEQKDVSVAIKSGEEGVVHKVRISTMPNGYKMVKVVLRNVKIPEVGDKFASRAAQKGTCGMVFRQEDMPFTAQGITPDIILNPHCFPSRMTINQIMECVASKECVIKGKFGDATPFSENSVDIVNTLCDRLEKVGYEKHGLETLYNPYTGEKMKAQIFIGPTYYQRLKHMVSDKIHSRAKGHVTALTRQPLEGRSRDGGLRFGEMERDAMIAHGVSRFLKERLFDMSDPYNMAVCSECGMIASSQDECKSCKSDRITKVNIPYAAKLLFQELNAIGVKTELIPKK